MIFVRSVIPFLGIWKWDLLVRDLFTECDSVLSYDMT